MMKKGLFSILVLLCSSCTTTETASPASLYAALDDLSVAMKGRVMLIRAGDNSYGAGMIVGKTLRSCLVLTTKHTVQGYDYVSVADWRVHPDTPSQKWLGTSAYSWDSSDLTLITFQPENTDHCRPTEPSKTLIRPGAGVYVYGNPTNGSGTVSQGIVSAYWEIDPYGTTMVSDVLTVDGFSGGPVINEAGDFVGTVYGRSSDNRGRNFTYIIPNALHWEKVERAIAALRDQEIEIERFKVEAQRKAETAD